MTGIVPEPAGHDALVFLCGRAERFTFLRPRDQVLPLKSVPPFGPGGVPVDETRAVAGGIHRQLLRLAARLVGSLEDQVALRVELAVEIHLLLFRIDGRQAIDLFLGK